MWRARLPSERTAPGALTSQLLSRMKWADFAFGENAEQRGEGALGGVPRPAGFDEGDVDAAIDVLGAEAGVLAAVLAAERLDEAAVLPVQAIHAAALVVV
jgi:hypothetical protein